MPILNLNEMAKYGAYGTFFAGMSSWLRREDSSGVTYLAPYKYYGGTAILDVPLAPMDGRDALRLKTIMDAAGDSIEFQRLNLFFDPTDPPYLYKTALVYTSRPQTFAVTAVEDMLSPVQAKTDSGQGAALFKGSKIVGTLEFYFQPGVSQELSYQRTVGVDVTATVTEGVSNTTSSGGSVTTTISAELTGSFLGLGATGSLSREWTSQWGQSQTIDYSKSTTNTISQSQSVSAKFDLKDIQPNAQGEYYYGPTKLVPGQKYVMSVTETEELVRAPVSGKMNITGGNLTFAANASMPSNYNNGGDYTYRVTKNIAEYILEATKLGYDYLYQGNLAERTWNLEANPTMLQMGIVAESRFSGAAGLLFEVKPVATKPALALIAPAAGASSLQAADPQQIYLDDYDIPGNAGGGGWQQPSLI